MPRAMQVRHIMIVVLVLAIEQHSEVAAVDSRLLHPGHRDLEAIDWQACQRPAHGDLIGTEVEQGADEHIAGNTALAVQIERTAAPHRKRFRYFSLATLHGLTPPCPEDD